MEAALKSNLWAQAQRKSHDAIKTVRASLSHLHPERELFSQPFMLLAIVEEILLYLRCQGCSGLICTSFAENLI
jgi:hypothetical protein